MHPINTIMVKKDKPGVPRPEEVYDSGNEPSDEDELRAYQNEPLQNFAGYEIFRNPVKFYNGSFSSVFYSSFLWFLICNTDFNSDSLCLS